MKAGKAGTIVVRASNRYKRMEAGWRALAEEQDWLEGTIHPLLNARYQRWE
jgi:hypothetical protein